MSAEGTPLAEITPETIRAVAAHLRDGYPEHSEYPVELFVSRPVARKIAELLDELADIREETGGRS